MGKINLDNIRKQMERVEDAYAGAELRSQARSLTPAEIVLNPNNLAAENDNEETIKQLADSIEAAGLIHPLTVMKIAEHQYMLLSGERRYKAITTHLHWDYIPCMVYEKLDEDMVTLVTIQANMEAREYSVAQRLALYQQLDSAIRSLKEKGKFKGGVGRGIAKIMRVSERQISAYKKITDNAAPEEIAQITNINKAVADIRSKEKTYAQRKFSETPPAEKTYAERKFSDNSEEEKTYAQRKFSETPPAEKTYAERKFSDNSEEMKPSAECQCVSCTCTGCHEDCYGHCHGCGDKTTDCNGYQNEGTKRLEVTRKPSSDPAPNSPLKKTVQELADSCIRALTDAKAENDTEAIAQLLVLQTGIVKLNFYIESKKEKK